MSLAIALLDGLLDKPDITAANKRLIRNTLIPVIEAVEEQSGPRERMETICRIITLISVPLGYALASSTKSEAHNRLLLDVTQNLYSETQEILSIFANLEKRKAKSQMD